MKEYLKQRYYWWAHLLWSIKVLVKCFFKMDYKGMVEAYYWTKIHLTHKSRRIK